MFNSILNTVLNVGVNLLKTIVPAMTDSLREHITKFIKELDVLAKKTPNQFDDVLVSFLKTLFTVE